MTCRDFERFWIARSSDELPPAVQAHLAGCSGCTELVQADTATNAFLRRVRTARPPVDADLAWKAIEGELGERSRQTSGIDWHRPLTLAVTRLACAAFAGVLLLGYTSSTKNSGSKTVSSSTGGRGGEIGDPSATVPAPDPRSLSRSLVGRRDADADSTAPPAPARATGRHAPRRRVPRTQSPIADDLVYVNRAPEAALRQRLTLPQDDRNRTEAHVRRNVTVRDDFVQIPFPRIADVNGSQMAAAVESYQREAAIVDPRLSHEVTCAFKATALSDLCDRLRADTGIQLGAGASVADEKVTVFCEKLPLRDLMRQLSRPFGYTWLRSSRDGQYRYELVQDLKSQLLEEELRNRDRNEALLALEQEIEKYRPYLSLSPDEVLARAKTAPPAEKKVLEDLGGGRPGLGLAWGITQMYFRLTSQLTSQELAALRAGEELAFRQEPEPGEKLLPPDVARGVLQSLRTWHLLKTKDGYAGTEPDDPRGIPLTAVPEARALVNLKLSQTELGQFGLRGLVGFSAPGAFSRADQGPYAVGVSPRTLQPENAVVNAKFAHDPALRPRVSVQPQPSCHPSPNSPAWRLAPDRGGPPERESELREPKVITADVLEALHRATGMPIIADFYTRLYMPDTVSIKNQPLFDTLNQLCDTMRLRWNKGAGAREAGAWLQFRSMAYYYDRLKEVPNRLLTGWAAARREHGMLSLEELVEIAQLPDAQLDASSMAEGARECWGLPEWDLARDWAVLPNLRFLARLTSAQRQEAQSVTGLLTTKMSLAQQQAFLSRFAPWQPQIHSLEELSGTALRVEYTQPGWFEWQPPAKTSLRWVVRSTPDGEGKWLPVPVVRERTREAALQALRRVDPQIRAAVQTAALAAAGSAVVPATAALPPEEAQIVTTGLDLTTLCIPGTAKAPVIFWIWNRQSLTEYD
jgi:hypothetical protein